MMSNDSEMLSYAQNKPYLIVIKNTNYFLLDSYIFLPHGLFQMNLTDPTVISLQLDIIKPDINLLLCLQIKKDLEVVLNQYSQIVNEWEEKKSNLEKIYNNCSFLLVLATQSYKVETGKQIISFKKDDTDICILFADEVNSKYFIDKI